MDETYIGGRRRGKGNKAKGRGTDKPVVIGIRERGGNLRFFHAQDAHTGTLATYIKDNISEDVDVIVTDEYAPYKKAISDSNPNAKHETVKHSAWEYVRGDIHTNTVESAFSLLKRGILGTWHKISAKHLAAYLDEMTWRFNNRKNPFLFRDTMLKPIHSDNLEYKELTKAA